MSSWALFRETKHTCSTQRNFQCGQEKLISEEGTRIALFCSLVQAMRLHLARSSRSCNTLLFLIRSPRICKCQASETVSQWIRIRNSKLFLRKTSNFIDQSWGSDIVPQLLYRQIAKRNKWSGSQTLFISAVTFCMSLLNKIMGNSTTKMLQVFKGAVLEWYWGHSLRNFSLRSIIEFELGVVNEVATTLPGRQRAASNQIFNL